MAQMVEAPEDQQKPYPCPNLTAYMAAQTTNVLMLLKIHGIAALHDQV